MALQLANTTVTTKRGSVAKLSGAPAHRYKPHLVYTPDGQVVETKYKLDYPVDVTEGDSVTESDKPAGTVRLVTPYPPDPLYPFDTDFTCTDILVVRPVV